MVKKCIFLCGLVDYQRHKSHLGQDCRVHFIDCSTFIDYYPGHHGSSYISN